MSAGIGGACALIPGSIVLGTICRDFNKPFARRQISTLAGEMNGFGGEDYSGSFRYQPLEEWNEWNQTQGSEPRRTVQFQDETSH